MKYLDLLHCVCLGVSERMPSKDMGCIIITVNWNEPGKVWGYYRTGKVMAISN